MRPLWRCDCDSRRTSRFGWVCSRYTHWTWAASGHKERVQGAAGRGLGLEGEGGLREGPGGLPVALGEGGGAGGVGDSLETP